MKIQVESHDSGHASLLEGLAMRAFESVSEDARPDQGAEFIAHLLGDANPAGPSRVALAREGDQLLGCLAAVPSRFRRRDGSLITGRQIGYYFVDHAAQGKGVGHALLVELSDALRAEEKGFVFTFPNPRSIGRFDRLGYRRVASIPTLVSPTWPRRRQSSGRLSGPDGMRWEFEEAKAAAAHRIATVELGGASTTPGCVRDADYFAWRMCGPDADDRYRFAVCRQAEGECFIAVLAAHTMLGLPFTILVDVIGSKPVEHQGMAVRVAGRMGVSPLVYSNSNAARFSEDRGLPLARGVPVPSFANPRPIELLMLPGVGDVEAAELADFVWSTADWLGF